MAIETLLPADDAPRELDAVEIGTVTYFADIKIRRAKLGEQWVSDRRHVAVVRVPGRPTQQLGQIGRRKLLQCAFRSS